MVLSMNTTESMQPWFHHRHVSYLLLVLAITISVTFVVSDTLLTLKQPLPSLLLQFTPNSIIATLDISTFLKMPIYRLQLLQNLILKLNTSPLYSSAYTGEK